MKVPFGVILSALNNSSQANNGLVRITPTSVFSIGPSMSVETTIAATEAKDNEEYVLSHARLALSLKPLQCEYVTLSTDKGKAVIRAGRSVVRLPLSITSEVPNQEPLRDWSEFSGDVLQAAKVAITAVQKRGGDDSAQSSQGVSFRPLNGSVVACGYDRNSMCFSFMSEAGVSGVVWPSRLVSAVCREEVEKFHVSYSDNLIGVRIGNVTYCHRKLGSSILEIEKMIPGLKLNERKFYDVSREDFSSALRAVTPFSEAVDISSFVLRSDLESFNISGKNQDGEVESEIDSTGVAPGSEIRLNSRYIISFLGAVDDDIVKISFSGPTDKFVMKGSVGGLEAFQVVAPMKL